MCCAIKAGVRLQVLTVNKNPLTCDSVIVMTNQYELLLSTMVDDLFRKLQKKEAEVETLRRQVEAKQRKRLASLHKELGFSSVEELIAALRGASRGAKPRAVAAGGESMRASKRARVTPDMRQRIEAALQAGEKGAAVARKFGISYPTLHKIKTQVGLVTPRPSRRRRASKKHR